MEEARLTPQTAAAKHGPEKDYQPESGIVLERMFALVSDLENKLYPILRPAIPTPNKDVSDNASALITQMNKVADRICEILERVHI